MINAVVISEKDNVVVVREYVKKGEEISYRDLDGEIKNITALDDIKIYHKVAREEIKQDDNVIKYGEHIGVAGDNIHIGNHVHEHNVISVREDL